MCEVADTSKPKRVAIIGSGNWGSAIARIIGSNILKNGKFDSTIQMYVFEEIIDGQKLSEIINTKHENVKYLPGFSIPSNVGFDITPGGGIELISSVINKLLNIDMAVLMGANLAGEVAAEKFCETTIGCKDKEAGKLLKELIQTDYFRVVVVDDINTIEVCGALKNIVACGAGFVDGLGYGDNTKAAVIRLGLMEMIKFADVFYPGSKLSTFFESCGVADLITTCYGGRNRKVAEAFVKTGKRIEELENEMLNGQRMQGPQTAEEVHIMLKSKGMEKRFPLFTAIHQICQGNLPPTQMINCIKNHPEHV
ncbi:glycerol-3-phosphate dehydrogenase [NAD(+)], cytoplasmic-like isoform X2 [Tachypleus tridentatus]|uniref:glycerol-3-phosphate dehydrogenase [NAD(+)], cytoplasmic-like isoform X2 n=1 Tax=Tachypleus tridentatus TaxID=6853 RepID=UPI003FD50830